jgi:cysteinyl-tRNA synthetase
MNSEGRKAFTDAMEADLNMPMALTAIQGLAARGVLGAQRDFREEFSFNFHRQTSVPLSIIF